MKYNVVGIGEVLWDLLPSGRQMGGAPANFAYHASALGADARVISRVGNDADGRELIERLQKLGVSTDCIEIDPAARTGTVSVQVSPSGQPHFTIHENVAWDFIAGSSTAESAVAAADAICFGTLAQRSALSRDTIQRLVAATKPARLRILDVNLRQHYFSAAVIEKSLALANVLKVNDTELPRLAEMFQLMGSERMQMTQLAEGYDLRLVAYTRGERGSLLYSRWPSASTQWSDHPGVATQVKDTVGAGDSFTAAMALGLLAGWHLDTINQRANEIAAYVCSCSGGTPPLPENLRAPFQSNRTKS